jgi:hypothetical protein
VLRNKKYFFSKQTHSGALNVLSSSVCVRERRNEEKKFAHKHIDTEESSCCTLCVKKCAFLSPFFVNFFLSLAPIAHSSFSSSLFFGCAFCALPMLTFIFITTILSRSLSRCIYCWCFFLPSLHRRCLS